MSLRVTASIWALFVAMTLWFPVRRGPVGFATFVLTMTLDEIPRIFPAVFVGSASALPVRGFDDDGSGQPVATMFSTHEGDISC